MPGLRLAEALQEITELYTVEEPPRRSRLLKDKLATTRQGNGDNARRRRRQQRRFSSSDEGGKSQGVDESLSDSDEEFGRPARKRKAEATGNKPRTKSKRSRVSVSPPFTMARGSSRGTSKAVNYKETNSDLEDDLDEAERADKHAFEREPAERREGIDAVLHHMTRKELRDVFQEASFATGKPSGYCASLVFPGLSR